MTWRPIWFAARLPDRDGRRGCRFRGQSSDNDGPIASLARPAIRAKYDDLGLRIHAASPAEFGKLVADDTEKWGKVIRAANIKLQ